MEVLQTQPLPDIQFSKEKPQHTHLVTLPEVTISSSGHRIRLHMHTDNIGNLLKVLHSLPGQELLSLAIEGRNLSYEQSYQLSRHPLYKFYTALRTTKVLISEALTTIAYYSKDSSISPEEARGLITRSFSPTTLATDLGYETSYYNAHDLLEHWLQTGDINDFLPMLGGCNEFTIGSDDIFPEQLKQIGDSISSYIADQQYISKRIPLRFLEQLSYIISLRDLQPIPKIPPRTTDFLEDAKKLSAVFSDPGSEL